MSGRRLGELDATNDRQPPRSPRFLNDQVIANGQRNRAFRILLGLIAISAGSVAAAVAPNTLNYGVAAIVSIVLDATGFGLLANRRWRELDMPYERRLALAISSGLGFAFVVSFWARHTDYESGIGFAMFGINILGLALLGLLVSLLVRAVVREIARLF